MDTEFKIILEKILTETDTKQNKLAELIGLKPVQITRLKKKQLGEIPKTTLRKIASALDIPIESFYPNQTERVHSLRESISRETRASKMLEQAISLYNFFYEKQDNQTLTALKNCHKLEEITNSILYNPKSGITSKSLYLSPREATFFLSALLLRDIGKSPTIPMPPTGNNSTPTARQAHAEKTAYHIRSRWQTECDAWNEEDKKILANICRYHSVDLSISEFRPIEGFEEKSQQPIRYQAIAGLLQLISSCSIDSSRPPRLLVDLTQGLNIDPKAVDNGGMANIIKDITFDTTTKTITLYAECPLPVKFPGGSFDFCEIAKLSELDIQNTLDSASFILNKFDNTDFHNVECKCTTSDSDLSLLPEKLLATWPFFLSKPTSASESYLAILHVLCHIAELITHPEKNGVEYTKKIITEAIKLHPTNAKPQKLYDKIISELDRNDNNDIYSSLMKIYTTEKSSYEKNCQDIISNLQREITPECNLFLFSFSVPITEFLKKISMNHTGAIYLIECDKPYDKHTYFQESNNENIKIYNLVRDCGLRWNFIKLSSVATALKEATESGRTAKMLLGIHGIYKGDFLCQNGSSVLARVTKSFPDNQAQCYIVTESSKISEDCNIKDQEEFDRLFKLCHQSHLPAAPTVLYRYSRYDTIPQEIVNKIITENEVKDVCTIQNSTPSQI